MISRLFWTGGFARAVDNARTAPRHRHERKTELLETVKQERPVLEAAHKKPSRYEVGRCT
ncbi:MULTISPECIES: hypothetical protein [Streptomyces]|uniref:Uncharacterized protein n=1 Tax=Streptomyces venezuelae TaxID=54571 RepID=A0A5P2AKZ4_STRVZ|nr:hypothetical protein [Streptomyces venezuelae]QES18467.1 hypothetical protein DEJ46_04620 [Streptomyces venezuelae]